MKRTCGFAVLLFLATGACGDPDEGASGTIVAGTRAERGEADALFDDSVVHDIHLTMSPADWDTILRDSLGDTYRRATLRWREAVVADVGVRPRGHATRHPGNPKYSLKIEMDAFIPDQEFLGLDEIKLDGLREGSQMRERLSYALMREAGVPAPRAAHCRLFVNGEYRGVYMIEEAPNRDLVKRRFGAERGNLYRVFGTDPEPYAYRGSSGSLYVDRPFERKTLGGEDHSMIPRFLDVLNHRPDGLESVLDVEALISFLAVEVVVLSRDTLLRDRIRPHNHYAYWRLSTGRFVLIPWDQDQCLSADRISLSLWHNFRNSAIARVVRDTPALNERFRRRLSEILEGPAHPDRMSALIDDIYRQIRDHVYADPHKLITNGQFDYFRGYLKDIFQRRRDRILSELGTP